MSVDEAGAIKRAVGQVIKHIRAATRDENGVSVMLDESLKLIGHILSSPPRSHPSR
jgi:hypothetical protein